MTLFAVLSRPFGRTHVTLPLHPRSHATSILTSLGHATVGGAKVGRTRATIPLLLRVASTSTTHGHAAKTVGLEWGQPAHPIGLSDQLAGIVTGAVSSDISPAIARQLRETPRPSRWGRDGHSSSEKTPEAGDRG